MKRLMIAAALSMFVTAPLAGAADDDGWISLFNGKNLDGWKASENPDSFQVEDGVLVVDGPRGHLFYDGPVEDANFTNFHLKADVQTKPNANSGIYFHTRFQESGWPSAGYEIQVNVSHRDPKKSGGLYGVRDVADPPAKDNEWYTQEIIVQGKRIISKIDGEVLVDYTEQPGDVRGDRRLSSGTFAIQAHDPDSKILFKNIRVKPLD
ncbi:MAG: 3-keto-disaccharide hydrolase [Thermoguttaceae bacterium]